MDNDTLRDWISASLKKFAQEHFYEEAKQRVAYIFEFV